VAIDYGVTGVPESFFIDRGGRILHKQTGPLNPPALESQLARLVQP
jgi:cytochrome c biogenesis protein CcmG/thiol:disulfide interchange protein DsbE